jgi:ankyrin repeat protein
VKPLFLLSLLALAPLQAQPTSADLLRRAIGNSDLKTMETLLSSGLDPNLPDRSGQTPLNLAMVVLGQTKTVELLLSYFPT